MESARIENHHHSCFFSCSLYLFFVMQRISCSMLTLRIFFDSNPLENVVEDDAETILMYVYMVFWPKCTCLGMPNCCIPDLRRHSIAQYLTHWSPCRQQQTTSNIVVPWHSKEKKKKKDHKEFFNCQIWMLRIFMKRGWFLENPQQQIEIKIRLQKVAEICKEERGMARE